MAQSGGGHGGEITSAFGGAAELHGRMASVAVDANDPQQLSIPIRVRVSGGGTSARGRLARFNIECADHFGPFFGFVCDKFAEVGR